MGAFVDIAQGYLDERRAVGCKMEKGEAFVRRLDALRAVQFLEQVLVLRLSAHCKSLPFYRASHTPSHGGKCQ